jgi:hypothetical protein
MEVNSCCRWVIPRRITTSERVHALVFMCIHIWINGAKVHGRHAENAIFGDKMAFLCYFACYYVHTYVF